MRRMPAPRSPMRWRRPHRVQKAADADAIPTPPRTRIGDSVPPAFYTAMAMAGVVFGWLAPWQPFGDEFFSHPLVVFALVVLLALLALRIGLRRPLPEIVPDRVVLIGIVVGLGAFLAANFVAVALSDLDQNAQNSPPASTLTPPVA